MRVSSGSPVKKVHRAAIINGGYDDDAYDVPLNLDVGNTSGRSKALQGMAAVRAAGCSHSLADDHKVNVHPEHPCSCPQSHHEHCIGWNVDWSDSDCFDQGAAHLYRCKLRAARRTTVTTPDAKPVS